MINVINSLSFIRGVYRKKKIKYIFITYSEARATQENSYFKDKGKRKKLEKKKKKIKAAAEASSQVLHL